MNLQSALEQTFYSTVRVEVKTQHGKQSSGTCFVFEYKSDENSYPFLVTARRLVEEADEGRMTFIQSKNNAPAFGKGYTLDIEHFSKLWYSHPDQELDIAITPFVPFVKHIENSGVPVHFKLMSVDDTSQARVNSQLNLASDLFYLGYPIGVWDRKNLLPVLRKGSIASPLSINYFGRRQFVLDIPSTSGAEGSPVIYCQPNHPEEDPVLVGMLVKPGTHSLPGESNGDDVASQDEDPGMGIVVRSEAIIDTIQLYLKEKGFI